MKTHTSHLIQVQVSSNHLTRFARLTSHQRCTVFPQRRAERQPPKRPSRNVQFALSSNRHVSRSGPRTLFDNPGPVRTHVV